MDIHTIKNSGIGSIFEEIADLLEVKGDNPFRIRAYRNAGRLIDGLGVSIAEMLASNEDLTELPGIGVDLAEKIKEIVNTGRCQTLEQLQKKLPPTLSLLLKIPGLGPKRVQMLYRKLDISSPEQLHAAALEGRIREVAGFGAKTEAAILQAIEEQAQKKTRFPLATVARYAEPLKEYLAQVPQVLQVVIAGSYRRHRETVGDLDLLVVAKRGSQVMEYFINYSKVAQVLAQGKTRASVRLENGLQVDLRVVSQISFGSALHYFTGSKAHNIAIRRLGQKKHLKINEYGVFRGNRRIAGKTEESVYAAVGLPYISPELRENRGEIQEALKQRLRNRSKK